MALFDPHPHPHPHPRKAVGKVRDTKENGKDPVSLGGWFFMFSTWKVVHVAWRTIAISAKPVSAKLNLCVQRKKRPTLKNVIKRDKETEQTSRHDFITA